MNNGNGLFISLEGLEGCGKSTIAKRLVEILRFKGFNVHHMREPGGTKMGEKIRNILIANVKPKDAPVPVAELLLFMAARVQNIETVVRPFLKNGGIVISERFLDSTYALQGYGRQMIETVEKVTEATMGNFNTHRTYLLDISIETSKERQKKDNRKADRFEAEEELFYKNTATGFKALAAKHGNRIKKIDAEQPFDKVLEDICLDLTTLITQCHTSLKNPELEKMLTIVPTGTTSKPQSKRRSTTRSVTTGATS